jgi:hypothetical protein
MAQRENLFQASMGRTVTTNIFSRPASSSNQEGNSLPLGTGNVFFNRGTSASNIFSLNSSAGTNIFNFQQSKSKSEEKPALCPGAIIASKTSQHGNQPAPPKKASEKQAATLSIFQGPPRPPADKKEGDQVRPSIFHPSKRLVPAAFRVCSCC